MSVIIDKKTIIGPTAAPPALILTWDNISNVPVGDPANVNDWNTFFDLPTYGTPFTSVEINGNDVILRGGSNDIVLKSLLFELNSNLISIVDTAGYILLTDNLCFNSAFNLTIVNLPSLISAAEGCFGDCMSLTTINLPSLSTAGNYCFYGNTSLTTINLPSLSAAGNYCFSSCWNLTTINLPSLVAPNGLGGSPADNFVFYGINTNDDPIDITIPAAFQTNNGGSYDGDLQYLINTYPTVNITPV